MILEFHPTRKIRNGCQRAPENSVVEGEFLVVALLGMQGERVELLADLSVVFVSVVESLPGAQFAEQPDGELDLDVVSGDAQTIEMSSMQEERSGLRQTISNRLESLN